MYSITLAYANSDFNPDKSRRPQDPVLAFYIKKIIRLLNIVPQIHGHGYTILRSPEETQIIDFAPKIRTPNIPVKETRPNAKTLYSSYSKVPLVLRALSRLGLYTPLQTCYEGKVSDGSRTYSLSYAQADLTIHLQNRAEFEKAQRFVNAARKNPPSYSFFISNCISLGTRITKECCGFDLQKYAGQKNVFMPAYYLTSFLDVAKLLNPVADNKWKGMLNGKSIEVTFRDRSLLATARKLQSSNYRPKVLKRTHRQNPRNHI